MKYSKCNSLFNQIVFHGNFYQAQPKMLKHLGHKEREKQMTEVRNNAKP
jgi:hypothetical protein